MENTWDEKIDYTLSTPTKGVIYGTSVPVNFRIASLLKGLKIREVHTKVSEEYHIIIEPRRHAMKTPTRRVVAEDKFDFPEGQETALVDDQDAWVFTRHLTLPRNLRQCVQTVNALGINVNHKVIFNVKLVNPDEHISEVSPSPRLEKSLLTMSGQADRNPASAHLYIA